MWFFNEQNVPEERLLIKSRKNIKGVYDAYGMMNRSVLKSGSNPRTLTKSEFSWQSCRTINVLRNLPWKYRTLTYFKAGESYFTEFLDIHDLYTFSWHAFFCKKKKWYHWGYFRVCISLLVSDGSKFLCITEDCIWGREAEGTKIFWSTSGTLCDIS